MFRILLPLIAGVGFEISADYLHRAHEILSLLILLFCISLVVISIISLLKNITWTYRLRSANGIALSVLVISFGYVLTWFYADKNFGSHFQNYLTNYGETQKVALEILEKIATTVPEKS